jgi:RNA polymerase sigma factor (sigma-70 family)
VEKKVDELIGHLFRQEAGRMASVLTRLLGFSRIEIVEDIVQDTLVKAMTIWKFKGIPENPSAWLYTVAKRQAIDVLRQERVRDGINSELSAVLKSEYSLVPTVNHFFLDTEIGDSELRMIFACCHPAIPYDAQVALTLKTLCGLSVSEIARSFFTTEETITKRLYRAKEKIQTEKISLDVPVGPSLISRMESVLHTLYLLFNEGYNSSHADYLIRQDLCMEAMRLAIILTSHATTSTSEANALVALMSLQVSRENARQSSDGSIVLMEHQDRTLWNRQLIEIGLQYLDRATENSSVSEYHLEAAIAALHAIAPTFKETNWEKIHFLYEALLRIKPGPVVELNKAIALGYSTSADRGLKALLSIEGLGQSYLYHAALGNFYEQVGEDAISREHYQVAISLTNSTAEKNLMLKKYNELPK